jgi:hypothetical protein
MGNVAPLSTFFKQPEKTQQIAESINTKDKILAEHEEIFRSHPLHGEELTRRAFYHAWYNGHQNVKVAFTKDKLVIDKAPKQGLRYKSRGNILKRNGRDAISMLIKDNPIGTCIPMDSTPGSRQAAQVGNYILLNAYDRPELSITRKMFHAAENAYVMGTGWLSCKWNPKAFFFNASNGKWQQIGDIMIGCHDDFEIFPDFNAKNWFDVQWIYQVYAQDVDVVKKLYPKYANQIKEYDANTPEEQRYLYRPNQYFQDKPSKKPRCLVAEYYKKPLLSEEEIADMKEKDLEGMGIEQKEKYFGKKHIMVNWNVMVDRDINPYSEFGYNLCLPYVPIYWYSSGAKLHGDSPLREQIPRQYEYSKFNSIIGESGFFHGIPRMSVVRGSGLKNRTIDDNPRTILETQDGKIYIANPPRLPDYIFKQRDFVSMECQRDANTGSMAFGELPTGFSGSSGSALRQLMSRQLGRYAPEVEDLKLSTKLLNLLILNNFRFNVSEERCINIIGPDRRYKIKKFKKTDLQGSVDLMMEATSAYRNSPAAKAELAMNLWDRQVFQFASMGDPSAYKLMNVLEFGNIEEITRKNNLHRDRAEWNLEVIKKKNKMPNVYPTDNHMIHLEVIEMEMANPDFEDMYDDKQQQLLAQIAKIHMWYLQQIQNPQENPPGTQDNGVTPQGQAAEQNTEQNVESMQAGGSVVPIFGQGV